MSSIKLIIDGYNVMHAAGFARRIYGPGGLQQARQRLLRFLLQHLSASERAGTVVVFDARDRPQDVSSHMGYLEAIRVLFAAPHGDADQMIEELIAEHSSPKQLTVITSDRRLQAAARRRSGLFLDSESFVEDLLRRPRRQSSSAPVEPHPKESGNVSSAEVEFWMREFSGLADEIPEPAPPARKSPSEPTPQSISPAPSSPSSKRKRAHKAPGDGERRHRDKPPKGLRAAPPEIFSTEWLQELQQWVDHLQSRRQ